MEVSSAAQALSHFLTLRVHTLVTFLISTELLTLREEGRSLV